MFRIKEILKEKDIKVGDFAEKLGMKQSNMSSIINSKSNPSLEMLQKIADELGVGLNELFANDGLRGYIEYNGDVHKINSIQDIEKLLEEIKSKG